jgi:hypothetical protein
MNHYYQYINHILSVYKPIYHLEDPILRQTCQTGVVHGHIVGINIDMETPWFQLKKDDRFPVSKICLPICEQLGQALKTSVLGITSHIESSINHFSSEQ